MSCYVVICRGLHYDARHWQLHEKEHVMKVFAYLPFALCLLNAPGPIALVTPFCCPSFGRIYKFLVGLLKGTLSGSFPISSTAIERKKTPRAGALRNLFPAPQQSAPHNS